MIDKKIYYCWFGRGKRSDFEEACIDSWHRMCPDYEIVEINEDNFDVNITEFCKEAYANKNYVFVSDVARMEVLRHHSGFYLDTDIMLYKSLDELRKYNAIVPLDSCGFYNTAPIGCDKFPEIFKAAADRLTFGTCLNTLLNEEIYKRYDIYGEGDEVFDDILFTNDETFITPGSEMSEKTIGVHFCLGTWTDKWQGGYDAKKSFSPFEVYQNGIRDTRIEKKYYEDMTKIGILEIKGTVFRQDMIYYGNYFFNPNVMQVLAPGLEMTRYQFYYNKQMPVYIRRVKGAWLICKK